MHLWSDDDSLCDVYLALPIERYLTASLVLANMMLSFPVALQNLIEI
jgi:hypothetical protein